jgi:hypothetical protein
MMNIENQELVINSCIMFITNFFECREESFTNDLCNQLQVQNKYLAFKCLLLLLLFSLTINFTGLYYKLGTRIY